MMHITEPEEKKNIVSYLAGMHKKDEMGVLKSGTAGNA